MNDIVEAGKRREAQGNLEIGLKDALAPFLDRWVPVPFFQARPGKTFKDGPSDWARARVVDLEARHGDGFRDEHGHRYRVVLAFDTGLLPELDGRAYLAPSPKDVASGAIFALASSARFLCASGCCGSRWTASVKAFCAASVWPVFASSTPRLL